MGHPLLIYFLNGMSRLSGKTLKRGLDKILDKTTGTNHLGFRCVKDVKKDSATQPSTG
jgi:hypothetical protein